MSIYKCFVYFNVKAVESTYIIAVEVKINQLLNSNCKTVKIRQVSPKQPNIFWGKLNR